MIEDKNTVSNEAHEIDYFAKKLGVSRSIVMTAKELTGSNDRKVLEDYINSLDEENKVDE